MTLQMFDSVTASLLPAGPGFCYAGYTDGRYADVAQIKDRFPDADILSISVFAADNADALDIENGDATPAEAAGWVARQLSAGVSRPCLYASVSTMSQVLAALADAGVSRETLRLWSAHYGEGQHICGPGSCRQISQAMDGTQWTDTMNGVNVDQSLLLPDFFGAVSWEETMMEALPTLSQGASGTAVRTVQGLCAARSHPLTIDGSFGPATEQAVKACQQDAKVTVDGIVGQVTWTYLVTAA
jgi:hypothetical protein